jgi:hypothetical protein
MPKPVIAKAIRMTGKGGCIEKTRA